MGGESATKRPLRAWVRRVAPGVDSLSHYQRSWLGSDVRAGLSVAAVALPVGIAYAGLAGVPPVIGIYSAIFPLFAYALFGSSRQLMTGPDAATCIMVAAILGPLAGGDPARYQGLLVVLTLATGSLYLLAGVARLGFIANFLSLPILTGFLNGIALIIVLGQLPKLLGYPSEAGAFVEKLVELSRRIGESHVPTTILGIGLLLTLVAVRRLAPRLPSALVIVVLGIALASGLGLDAMGVSVLGSVPSGLPPGFQLPALSWTEVQTILRDSAGIVLVSFTSGILTSKSFAQRNGYAIRPSQDLIGFGACNLASGLAQGFPVTGADSRTAINDAMGGKSQVAGIVAGAAMLLVLFFLTEPLAWVPNAALAAVIIVSASGLVDLQTLRMLFESNRVELAFSMGTTLGVLTLGVLPGVLLSVVLSLTMLLAITSRARDEVLGRVPGMKGFHGVEDYPEAETIPGLLLFRFDADIVFFNADYFKERLLAAVAASEEPVEWVVLDASPVNFIDSTAVRKFDELRAELGARGIELAIAQEKRTLERFFEARWVEARRERIKTRDFPTLKAAVRAFRHRRETGAQPPPG